ARSHLPSPPQLTQQVVAFKPLVSLQHFHKGIHLLPCCWDEEVRVEARRHTVLFTRRPPTAARTSQWTRPGLSPPRWAQLCGRPFPRALLPPAPRLYKVEADSQQSLLATALAHEGVTSPMLWRHPSLRARRMLS
uniref:Uncharacterized protein n=1 Tax=Chrysemys picta bellii TaxID=8478 RepID=A0A8C3FG49_CHRPI